MCIKRRLCAYAICAKIAHTCSYNKICIFKFQQCANIASGQILGRRDVNKRSVSVCSDCCTSDICNTNCRKKGE